VEAPVERIYRRSPDHRPSFTKALWFGWHRFDVGPATIIGPADERLPAQPGTVGGLSPDVSRLSRGWAVSVASSWAGRSIVFQDVARVES
jgi:hypothetical protein